MVHLEVGWEHGLVCVISDFRSEVAEKGAQRVLETFYRRFGTNISRILRNFGCHIMLGMS